MVENIVGKMLHGCRPTASGATCFVLLAITLVSPAVWVGQGDSSSEPKQEDDASGRAASIAAELANPNTVLGTLNFNFDAVGYGGDLRGAGNQSAFRSTGSTSRYRTPSGPNGRSDSR